MEASFRPRSEHERQRLLGLGRPLVEVHCCCPPDLAARRFELRAGSGARRLDVHPLTVMPPHLLAEFDGPVGLGDLVTADTSGPVPLDAVAQQVEAVLGRPVPR